MATIKNTTQSKHTKEHSPASEDNLELIDKSMRKKNAEKDSNGISAGISEEEDRELIKMYSAAIIEHQILARNCVNLLNSVRYQWLNSYKELDEVTQKLPFRKDLIREIEAKVSFFEKMIQYQGAVVVAVGDSIFTALEQYSKLATDHDFAKLICADEKDVERFREDYNTNHKNCGSLFFEELIIVYRAENSSKSACNKDKPLWEALLTRMLAGIHKK